MIKLSIIIPVYNASNYIETALQSIINQTITDIEVICINDGSTDNSSEIIEKYSSKYSYIKLFNQENSGVAIARNKGINEAKGKYIAFLDADDIYLDKESLNKMYDIAIKNNANMVSANLRKIKQNGQLEENYDYKNAQFTYFTKPGILKPIEYGIPWAFYKNIYKKDFLIKNDIMFPDLIRGQDPVFLAKILTIIDEIHTINIDFYGYNHSISGGLNIKLNTYKKIYDYITHFKQTFQILEKTGFETVLGNYKKEFIDYLNFRQNINNQDIKKIVSELFKDDRYFNESDYGYMIIDMLRNDVKVDDEKYEFIKHCLFEESMLEDTLIDIGRLKNFQKISQNNNMDEHKASFKQLKEIEKYTFEEKRQINGDVDRLKISINRFIKSNNEILTSNSWKLTSVLRSLKHNSGEK